MAEPRPDRDPEPDDRCGGAAGAIALLIAAAAFVIYRGAIVSYLLQRRASTGSTMRTGSRSRILVHLGRYNHFYRPVVEIYFFVGQRLFGCAALPFHLASVAHPSRQHADLVSCSRAS